MTIPPLPITPPLHADVRGGIRNWGGALGNLVDGDCVIAGFEQLRKCHAVTSASTWRKVLYRVGFRPPHKAYTVQIYAEYLSTVGLTPGPTSGVYPNLFFAWAQTQGLIKSWGAVDVTDTAAMQEAMATHHGCLLTLALTPQAYGSAAIPGGRWVTGTTKNYKPNPNIQHAIAMVEYNPAWWACVTWGDLVYLSPPFVSECVNGCYWFE